MQEVGEAPPVLKDRLNSASTLKLLDSDGPISQALRGFEAREQQRSMMQNVLDAFNGNQIALIEAGTGTGKSMAYLIPALLWAVQTGERTVISTNTIALQEQLLSKDIPLILKALKIPVKAVIVKGMSNYLCLRKMGDARQEEMFMPPQEVEEMRRLDMWSAQTRDGSRASLPFIPSGSVWEKSCAESDTCNRQECPHYADCFFFKARREAQEAQILIVNHHLLFADLWMRANPEGNRKDAGLLPLYTKVVLDEAHNIEDIATDYFAARTSEFDIRKILNRLAAEKIGGDMGKLAILKKMVTDHYGRTPPFEVGSIIRRLSVELPAARQDIQQLLHDAFSCYGTFLKMHYQGSQEEMPGESKLRILPHHHQHPFWISDIGIRSQALVDAILRYTQSLQALDQDIGMLRNEKLNDQTKGIRYEIQALSERLNGAVVVLLDFVKRAPTPEKVRWMETYLIKLIPNVTLYDVDLDVSKALANHLFNKLSSVILCSATLSTNKQFQFIRRRLGLVPGLIGERVVQEHIYESPFDYAQQALLAVPADMPLPSDPQFLQAAVERIWQAVEASRGNAFVLFTSYALLRTCYQLLEKRMRDHRYHPLKQGDDNRKNLLEKFRTTDRSVLFGTDSFWEGVDVAGEALRCVIIVKLPFKVPSEPIFQARSEEIQTRGGEPFFEYALPLAIVKFKQGFGRLIRNKTDRGCVVCLDTRLIKKGYGSQFFNSLPPCPRQMPTGDKLFEVMSTFYRKTYHLVTQGKRQ